MSHDTMTTAPVSFTRGALEELKRLMADSGLQGNDGLRVGVEGGGCSGMSYVLGFDKRQEGDEEFEISGIPVLLNKAHRLYLTGMEIDYRTGLDNRGFTFSNPNASSTCGCGSSFAV